jgi:hydroxyacylglutathione hydrolase
MKLTSLPIFNDNYIWVLKDEKSSEVLAVDPGESQRLIEYLKKNNLHLTSILLTHGHDDHIGGVKELITEYPELTCIWYHQDINHDLFFKEQKIIKFKTPGHLREHVSYFLPQLNILFCGDTLFSLGCGRIFETDFNKYAEQLWESLQTIIKMTNPETLVCCTHEYTLKNLSFCQTLENKYHVPQSIEEELIARFHSSKQTLPSTMKFELQFNPFLKAQSPDELKKLRLLRNNF